jgi:hypothetical protein
MSRGPCFLLIVVCATVQVAASAQPEVLLAGSATPVRGIFRFTSTSWTTLSGDGFNWVTDGGNNTNNYAGQRAAGLRGMVYLDAYDNSTCLQTMTDGQISLVVHGNVSGGNRGAIYQVGDEPTTNGCNASPSYSHMTSVIHAADSTARSWVGDDQFNDPSTSNWPAGLPMKGSVDILAFDIYPCQAGPCQYNMIDLAIKRIHSVGLNNWEFILQDFGPCQSWRAPTAQEVTQQFHHWQGAGALGYWVYAYDLDPTPCPGNVAGSAVLRQINALSVNPSKPAVKASPSPRAGASPTSNRSPKPVATISPGVGASPTADPGTQPPRQGGRLDWLQPQVLIGVGLLVAFAVVGLGYFRRRLK